MTAQQVTVHYGIVNHRHCQDDYLANSEPALTSKIPAYCKNNWFEPTGTPGQNAQRDYMSEESAVRLYLSHCGRHEEMLSTGSKQIDVVEHKPSSDDVEQPHHA